MPTGAYRRVMVVHGEKPHKTGEPHREFLMRLEYAIRIAERGLVDAIVVSGGRTRADCRTEADLGREYLRPRAGVPIVIEPRSRTTAENVLFMREMFKGAAPEKIIAVTSAKKLLRLRFLYWRLWPEARRNVDYVGIVDSYASRIRIVEWLYLLYALIDPRGRFFGEIGKKLFRNG